MGQYSIKINWNYIISNVSLKYIWTVIDLARLSCLKSRNPMPTNSNLAWVEDLGFCYLPQLTAEDAFKFCRYDWMRDALRRFLKTLSEESSLKMWSENCIRCHHPVTLVRLLVSTTPQQILLQLCSAGLPTCQLQ